MLVDGRQNLFPTLHTSHIYHGLHITDVGTWHMETISLQIVAEKTVTASLKPQDAFSSSNVRLAFRPPILSVECCYARNTISFDRYRRPWPAKKDLVALKSVRLWENQCCSVSKIMRATAQGSILDLTYLFIQSLTPLPRQIAIEMLPRAAFKKWFLEVSHQQDKELFMSMEASTFFHPGTLNFSSMSNKRNTNCHAKPNHCSGNQHFLLQVYMMILRLTAGKVSIIQL